MSRIERIPLKRDQTLPLAHADKVNTAVPSPPLSSLRKGKKLELQILDDKPYQMTPVPKNIF